MKIWTPDNEQTGGYWTKQGGAWVFKEDDGSVRQHVSYRGKAFSFLSKAAPAKAPTKTGPHPGVMIGAGSLLAKTIWDRDAYMAECSEIPFDACQLSQVYTVPTNMLVDSHFDMETEIRRDMLDAWTYKMDQEFLAPPITPTKAAIEGELNRRFSGMPVTPALEREIEATARSHMPTWSIAKDDIKVKLDSETGVLELTPVQYVELKITFSKVPETARHPDAVPPPASSLGGTVPPLAEGYKTFPTLGGYFVPPSLEHDVRRAFASDMPPAFDWGKAWAGETNNLDTNEGARVLTAERLIELRDQLRAGYGGPPVPPRRSHPMKTSTIEIPYSSDDPTRVCLADVPSDAEVVHVSGDASTVTLHVSQPDKPSPKGRPTAFFVVADGTDTPGLATFSGAPRCEPPTYLDDDGDEVEFIQVRRIGKFETEGQLFFVFERQDR